MEKMETIAGSLYAAGVFFFFSPSLQNIPSVTEYITILVLRT